MHQEIQVDLPQRRATCLAKINLWQIHLRCVRWRLSMDAIASFLHNVGRLWRARVMREVTASDGRDKTNQV